MRLSINIFGVLAAGIALILSNLFVAGLNKNSNFQILQDSGEITLVAVGDIMLSRVVEQKIIENGDYKYPFIKTSAITRNADITFGNLETAIIPGRSIQTGEMIFRTDPKAVEGLKYAGFDILNLANNHIMNFGKEGLERTIEELDKGEVLHIGAGMSEEEIYSPAIKEIKGVKFSFLGFTYNSFQKKLSSGDVYGIADMDIEKAKEEIRKAKNKADVVVVSMHAGAEYEKFPGNFQKDFAQNAIDAGADLVVGHHPHTVQGVERYKGKFIIYSLGNFVFDQMWSNETRLGAIAKVTFLEKEIKSIEFFPVKIGNYSQPEVIEGEEADMILKRLEF